MKVNDQVTVKVPMQRGNISEIRRGTIVATTENTVKVAFAGGFKPEEFPVDKVSLAKDSFGEGGNADNHYEKPIPKMFRR
jgi:hypothetical protein